jgi:hypothetical protein
MFESRLQYAQLILFGALIATVVGMLVLIKGPLIVGIFFLVLGNALAATGNGLWATEKGYPAYLGVSLGIGFGIMGTLFLAVLPDETEESPFAEERRMARRTQRKGKRKDKGYEVLEED